MKAIVKLAWLQDLVEANKERHLATFDKAAEAYKTKVIERMEENLRDARRGKWPSTVIALAQPMNQSEDYKRILAMLSAMHAAGEDKIELSEQDFNQYVLDKWSWKGHWSEINTAYGIEEE
jgi:hypothetical protein